jgi:hypothetical protein
MKGIAGYKDLFATYGDKARSLATRIMRESGYAAVRAGKLPYLAVPIGSTDYAFKLTRSHRNFILVPKAEYDNKVLPGQAGSKGSNALPSSTPRSASSPQGAGAEGTASSPDVEQGKEGEPSPLVFNDADLLNEEEPSGDEEGAS